MRGWPPVVFSRTFFAVSHEFQFVVGILQYVQARLSAPPTVEAANENRHLRVLEGGVGCFLNLHCGHNSAYENDEKANLASLIEAATAASESSVQQIV